MERPVPGIWSSRAKARAEKGRGRSAPGLGKREQILLLRIHLSSRLRVWAPLNVLTEGF